MKNKRGFLLAEQTLKIVIAVICIGFLVYFLVGLYFAKIEGQKQEQAENVLNRMEEIINSAGESEYQIPNPAGWYLFGFTSDKPASCFGKSCVCICSRDFTDLVAGTQLTECQEDGKCLVVENLKEFDKIKIKSPKKGLTNILIKNEVGQVSISEK